MLQRKRPGTSASQSPRGERRRWAPRDGLRLRHVGLGVGFVLLPTAASAGAWTLPEGTGEVDLTLTATSAYQAFYGSTLAPTPRYDKIDPQARIEYGITDAFTAILAPSLQSVDIAAPTGAQRTGLGYTEFGGRYRLFQNDSWVFSGQATLAVPGTFDNANPAAVGYTDIETDVRGLIGHGFSLYGLPAFVDLQFAERLRSGAPPNEFHADLTFGVEPMRRWIVLAQSFNVVSEGSGKAPFTSYDYYKFQLSAVYALTPTVSLQLGGVTTYAGRNALQENGLVAGVWCKF